MEIVQKIINFQIKLNCRLLSRLLCPKIRSMASPQQETQIIRTTAQLRSIASPKRLQIIRALEELGEGSVKELAARLGVKKESAYYHVHALVKSGIVVLHSRRSTDRRREAVYRLKAKSVEVDPEHQSRAYLEALADLVSTRLRQSDREHRAALLDPDTVIAGPERERGHIGNTGRLDRSALREINRMMEEVYQYMCENEAPEGEGEFYTVSLLIHPSLKQH